MTDRFALMAIRPTYTKHIFDGTKLFEFRTRPLAKDIRRVVVYETAPTSMVVGCFDVGRILSGEPKFLWSLVQDHAAGTDEEAFMKYFAGRDLAYAIRIVNPHKFFKPVHVRQYNGHGAPPQSWSYLRGSS